ncbi:unnamed protein product [Nezara viridula]|uniref:Uncharacterized protein n=1 Tax=Nezara viridula TaxID=85310 RepID=A0A9P0EEU1_NEZVI|nr:unnamed protein product [Nezara viridula]
MRIDLLTDVSNERTIHFALRMDVELTGTCPVGNRSPGMTCMNGALAEEAGRSDATSGEGSGLRDHSLRERREHEQITQTRHPSGPFTCPAPTKDLSPRLLFSLVAPN